MRTEPDAFLRTLLARAFRSAGEGDSLARTFVALVSTVAAMTVLAPSAFAQSGTGAERYEITITPPKRPGSQQPAADAAAPAPTGEAATGKEAAAPLAGSPPAAATGSATAPAAPTDPATVRATANLPLKTLQVGAYRQRSRAEQLQDALSPTFQDVTILEVQSGGESLYRVNVGRLPRGAGLDDLKRRLAAAGFPAFEVAAPADPARN